VITLAFDKLRILKTLSKLGTVVRFGIASALFSLIYKLVRKLSLIYKKDYNKTVFPKVGCFSSQDVEYATACGLSAFGLMAATDGDFKIFKVLAFSRATIAMIRLISETGLFKPIQESS